MILVLSLFIFHGVAGSFLPESSITMADGSRRLLKDVLVGDTVLSWDEESSQPSMSAVNAVLTFPCPAELYEIVIASNSIIKASEDQSFWSRDQGLASLDPSPTNTSHGLACGTLKQSEELEDEFQQPMKVALIQQSRYSCQTNARNASKVSDAAMTLKLEPHHWFYVHGVRVYSNGRRGGGGDGGGGSSRILKGGDGSGGSGGNGGGGGLSEWVVIVVVYFSIAMVITCCMWVADACSNNDSNESVDHQNQDRDSCYSCGFYMMLCLGVCWGPLCFLGCFYVIIWKPCASCCRQVSKTKSEEGPKEITIGAILPQEAA